MDLRAIILGTWIVPIFVGLADEAAFGIRVGWLGWPLKASQSRSV